MGLFGFLKKRHKKTLRKKKEAEKRQFNANVQGYLLTKSDRINRRIERFALQIKKNNSLIAVEDFGKFIKSIQILIAQELSIRGNTRDEERRLEEIGEYYRRSKRA